VRSRPVLRHFAPFALALAAFALGTPGHAASDAEAARRAKIAVKVGSRSVTVGELEDRIANISPFQIAALGASREAIVKAYVDQVVVRELVLAAGADERHLVKEEPTKFQYARALSNATIRAAHAALPSMAAIPQEDVAAYYEKNKMRFDTPERINVWRILCKTRDEASTVLEEAKKDSSIGKYDDLARAHSLDKATNLRGGNLGFLLPDGTSNEAGLKADPAVLEAARKVKDGELVPQPVPEGDAFAVVWRRATVPPSKRTLDDSSAQIRSTLYRERIDAIDKKLIDDLRQKNVKDVDYKKLAIVELGAFDAGPLNLPRGTPWPKPSSSAH
jgi:peptidyl-prolyl cis-trans isomerase C